MKRIERPRAIFILWVLVAGLVVGPIQAAAGAVTPAAHVGKGVNVRAKPSAQAKIVGFLDAGQLAAHLNSVASWHRVRLASGVEGYVSKNWTTLAEGARKDEKIWLGAWNVKELGRGDSTNYDLVARVIENNFDVLAIIEVMQTRGGHPGFDALMARLGERWGVLITNSPRPTGAGGDSEFYAIAYRVGTVRPCAGWSSLRYHFDNDGSSSGIGEDVFRREPAYGCFEAGFEDGVAGLDFILAAYHARWPDAESAETAETGGTAEIIAEVSHIDEVFDSMAASEPGEKDLLIAGAFNLVPADLELATESTDVTSGIGSTLDSKGGQTGNLYDHLLVRDVAATTELVRNARVLDVRGVVASHKEFYETVSDHLPIVATLRAGGTDDD